MKLKSKVATLMVAVVLSLVGFGILANALSVDRVMAGASPTSDVGVQITG